MKKIMFIILLTILISLSVYADEEKNTETENLYNFSNEDTTLLWYKNIEFTLGYNLGFCCRGEQLNNSPSDMTFDIIRLISGVAYWFDAIESGIRFPINNRVFEIGIGYGWANLDFYNVRKYYLYTGYIIKPYMCGLELNYSQGYGRDLIGGGIYFKVCNVKKNKKMIRFDPYLMFKIAGSYEIRSSSPYSELWDKKLTIWYTGLYVGFNINR